MHLSRRFVLVSMVVVVENESFSMFKSTMNNVYWCLFYSCTKAYYNFCLFVDCLLLLFECITYLIASQLIKDFIDDDSLVTQLQIITQVQSKLLRGLIAKILGSLGH